MNRRRQADVNYPDSPRLLQPVLTDDVNERTETCIQSYNKHTCIYSAAVNRVDRHTTTTYRGASFSSPVANAMFFCSSEFFSTIFF